MYKFEKADEAIWVAAVLLTYNEYMKMKDKELHEDHIYFKQAEILRKANDICTKEIEHARISYHLNADNDKASHKYFIKRKSDSFVRLVYNGEINGIKEKPNELNVDLIFNTINGEKTIEELIDFINNEYTVFIKNLKDHKKLTKEDYLNILEFLKEHSGEEYTKLEKIQDKDERDRCENLKSNAQLVITKFKNIGDQFIKDDFNYDRSASTWLDGSNKKIRNYFWIELKKKNKVKLNTSISIVAEAQNELRFRVALEIKDHKSNEKEYLRHFRYLNVLDIDNSDFEYFAFIDNDSKTLQRLNKEYVSDWIKKVRSREKNKILIGNTLTYASIKEMTTNEIENFFKESVKKLQKYYDIAVWDDEYMDNLENSYTSISKNQILCGPPGTGKTYNVIYRALEIIDNIKYNDLIKNPLKRDEAIKVFNQLLDDGQISFCTFHQSYGYEDFVEGLRSNESGNGFIPKDGIFKQICTRALNKDKVRRSKYNFDKNKINFFKMSLGEKGLNNDIYRYCIDNNCIALGWGGDVNYKNCQSMDDIREEFLVSNPDD